MVISVMGEAVVFTGLVSSTRLLAFLNCQRTVQPRASSFLKQMQDFEPCYRRLKLTSMEDGLTGVETQC